MAPQNEPIQEMPSSGPTALRQGANKLGGSILGKIMSPGAATPGIGGAGARAGAVAPTAAALASGGSVHNLKQGGGVKAKNSKEKAKVKGNSYSNDTIPAMLSEGEVVIPRDVMESGDPINASARFVAQVLAKRKVKP